MAAGSSRLAVVVRINPVAAGSSHLSVVAGRSRLSVVAGSSRLSVVVFLVQAEVVRISLYQEGSRRSIMPAQAKTFYETVSCITAGRRVQ